MKACRVSNIIAATCASCGARSHQIHRPIFKRGRYCHVCCPVCASAKEEKPKKQAAYTPTEPTRMAPGSQWLDLGYGPLRDSRGQVIDPFYSDLERRQEIARSRGDQPWIPRRPDWFRRRRA
jgi:hypothetical protein